MPPTLKPVEPKPPRWEPTPDPNEIIIPGLDTTAPINDQIGQIEQLITIKLQEIDTNFSKVQQVLSNRILPSLKRYAVATEPVREAAKFWVTFFEQAAQIRVPTYDELSLHAQENEESVSGSEQDHENQITELDPHQSLPQNQTHTPDRTVSESSFMPGQAAISSTPATTSRYRSLHGHGDNDDTPSWTASLESPLVRLDREIQSLTEDDAISVASSSVAHMSIHDEHGEVTQRPIQPIPALSDKGKGKELPESLRQNVLKRNTPSSDPSIAAASRTISPLKFKPKTPLLKTLNPYIPPDSNPSDWGGIVDLKSPTASTPSRTQSVSLPSFRSGFQTVTKASKPRKRQADDSFDDGIGMSPPITMAFARLPKLGQTPRKEAAERIMKNLLDVERRVAPGGTRVEPYSGSAAQPRAESTISSLLSPPSISKYTHSHPPHEPSNSLVDTSLESLIRRVGGGLDNHGVPAAGSRTSIASSHSHHSHPPIPAVEARGPSRTPPTSISADLRAFSSTPADEEAFQTPGPSQPQYNVFHLKDDELQPPAAVGEEDISSDSLDDEELNNTANPSAAFILASQRASYDDDDSDSFGSNQSLDSLNGEDMDPNAPVHPFARGMLEGDGFDDDSFDDPVFGGDEVEEETLFGVPPNQRLQAQGAAGGQLRMLGEGLLEDTMGIGAQMARAGRVEESPTPWGGRHGS